MENNLDRIRDERLKDRVVTPEEAASWIESGMTLGLSGFTRAGDVKAVPFALVNRVKNDTSFKVNVYTGASLGSDVDKLFAEAGILGKDCLSKLMRLCEKELITEIFYLWTSTYLIQQSYFALTLWM